MIIFITGATHTGKTYLAQKLLEKVSYPYLSLDHLKMGLIRSKQIDCTPNDSIERITSFIWPVTREMVLTALENKQNMIIEGCYIPFTYMEDFTTYNNDIVYICLIHTSKYLINSYNVICKNSSVIESRIDEGYLSLDLLLKENDYFYTNCIRNNLTYYLIENDFQKEIITIINNITKKLAIL